MVSYAREIKRKLFHTLGMIILFIFCAYVYFNYGILNVQKSLFAIFIVVMIGEIIVLDYRIYLPLYQELERKKEKRQMHGIVYVLLSAILCSIFFEPLIGFTAMCMLAFSDAAAALVGRKFGKHKFHKKSFEGTSAGFIVNLIIGFILLGNPLTVFGMSLGASLVELIIDKVDDNLLIPIVAGLIGSFL